MKVHQLIALLEDCDPEAEIRIMSQPSWPFEYAIRGIAIREEFAERDEDEDDPSHLEDWSDGVAANDVFIVEGAQERYGDKAAWDAVIRP